MLKIKKRGLIYLLMILFVNQVFAQNRDNDELHKTLRIDSHYSIETLDPAIAYDWLNYEVNTTLVCRLFSYANDADGNRFFINELAESYSILEDKKTYIFKIKENWFFSNGKNVVASDFKKSLERTLAPSRNSPGNGFFSIIKGYGDFVNAKAEELNGIEVLDKYRIKITLKRPKQSFLSVLTTNFAGIIDIDSSDQRNMDNGPVSCGTMYVDELNDDILITKKNPYHPHKDQIHWQQVEYRLNQPLRKSIHQLSRNKIDLIFSKISTSDGLHALGVLKPEEQILVFNDFNTIFIALNNHIPPFDNLQVRQAVNHAIDKNRIATHFLSEAGVVANQIIPPGMLGHVEGYKGYEYNVEKAKTLLRDAGYENGFTTEMISLDDQKITPITQAIREDLARIGVRLKIRAMNISDFLKEAAASNKSPMVFSEGVAWVAEYPHPSNFFYPLLSKNSKLGGWNWSNFFNGEVEKKVQNAEVDLVDKNDKDIDQVWGEIFLNIMDHAPWIPLYHNSTFTLKSDNIKFKQNRPLNIGGYVLQPFGLDGIYREKTTKK